MQSRPSVDTPARPDSLGSTEAVHAGERPLSLPPQPHRAHRADGSLHLRHDRGTGRPTPKSACSGTSRSARSMGATATRRCAPWRPSSPRWNSAQDAIVVSSGMAAVTATLLMLLQPGQHFILTDNCYHSTLEFSQRLSQALRHRVHAGALSATTRPSKRRSAPTTRLIFSESPTNPFMRCLDFARLVAHRPAPQAS